MSGEPGPASLPLGDRMDVQVDARSFAQFSRALRALMMTCVSTCSKVSGMLRDRCR